MDDTQNWPIEAWFRLAVLHCHISPDAFWNMPLRDWLWLCQLSSNTKFSQAKLTDLMAQFPDEKGDL